MPKSTSVFKFSDGSKLKKGVRVRLAVLDDSRKFARCWKQPVFSESHVYWEVEDEDDPDEDVHVGAKRRSAQRPELGLLYRRREVAERRRALRARNQPRDHAPRAGSGTVRQMGPFSAADPIKGQCLAGQRQVRARYELDSASERVTYANTHSLALRACIC